MRSLAGAVAVVFAALTVSCSGKGSTSDSALAIKPQDHAEGPAGSAASPAAAAVPASTTRTTAGARRTVLFLGTSLTAGLGLDPDNAYPQLIQRKIDARSLPYQVVNAGVSGETSAGLLRRLDWVLQRPADVIVVETGANDGLRGIPIESVRSSIDGILAKIRSARPTATIALVQMEALPNFGQQYTTAFHEMFGAAQSGRRHPPESDRRAEGRGQRVAGTRAAVDDAALVRGERGTGEHENEPEDDARNGVDAPASPETIAHRHG
jgi:lysophospholipase L1-like esterase